MEYNKNKNTSKRARLKLISKSIAIYPEPYTHHLFESDARWLVSATINRGITSINNTLTTKKCTDQSFARLQAWRSGRFYEMIAVHRAVHSFVNFERKFRLPRTEDSEIVSYEFLAVQHSCLNQLGASSGEKDYQRSPYFWQFHLNRIHHVLCIIIQSV